MRARMFKPQFAPLVKSGAKRQTIRPLPKRMPKVGDHESWRQWAYKPYKSPPDGSPAQIELAQVELTSVSRVYIDWEGVFIEGFNFFGLIATADGFKDWSEMREWFNNQHGLPFKGILIKARDLVAKDYLTDPNHFANQVR